LQYDFATANGIEEYCAMCLAIIVRNRSEAGSPMRMVNTTIIHRAISSLFKYGPDSRRRTSDGYEVPKEALNNAIALYFARIVRPIWNECLAKEQSVGENKIISPNLGINQCLRVENGLRNLKVIIFFFVCSNIIRIF